MRKICFSDRYGLTDAVLKGRKTMTRRLAFSGLIENPCSGYGLEGKEKDHYFLLDGCRQVAKSTYKVDEYVAIAQRYLDLRYPNGDVTDEFYKLCCKHYMPLECLSSEKGATNKLFVKPSLMPHQIQIIDVKIERLQDISDEDCLKEGIDRCEKEWGYWEHVNGGFNFYAFDTIRKAFASLIDKVSGKGTWEKNPWVFVYSFILIK